MIRQMKTICSGCGNPAEFFIEELALKSITEEGKIPQGHGREALSMMTNLCEECVSGLYNDTNKEKSTDLVAHSNPAVVETHAATTHPKD